MKHRLDPLLRPPFAAEYTRRRLNELKLEPLLQSFRGRPAANIELFCAMAARFSAMIDALCNELQEVDVNPANNEGAAQ